MKVTNISLKDIELLENSRKYETQDVSELMASIKESGLLSPIVVCKNFTTSKKPYILVAGNRRYDAVKKLDGKSINAVINNSISSLDEMIIINMTENIQRENVGAFEQGRLVHRLINELDYSLNEVAVKLGINPKKVKALLDIFHDTPTEFRGDISFSGVTKTTKGKIPLAAATTINSLRKSKLINRREVKTLYQDIKAGVLNTSDLRSIGKKLKEGLTLSDVKRVRKHYVNAQVRVPLLKSERDFHVEQRDLNEHLMKLIYGESKDHFTRPL